MLSDAEAVWSSFPAAPAIGVAGGQAAIAVVAAGREAAVTSAVAALRGAGSRTMATRHRRSKTMGLISAEAADRISAAITEAERNTSGEILAVVANQSSRYQHIPFMWAAL